MVKLLVGLVLAGLLALPASAGTGTTGDPYTVGSGLDYETITLAIAAASAGEFIEVQDPSITEDVLGQNKANITIRGEAGSKVIWIPATSIAYTGNHANADGWTFSNFSFVGLGTNVHSGFSLNSTNDSITITDCDFTNMRAAIYGAGVGSVLTISNINISSPQDTSLSTIPGIYLYNKTNTTMTNVKFDGRGSSGTDWVRAMYGRACTGLTIENLSVLLDSGEDGTGIMFDDDNSDISIRNSYFEGGSGSHIQFGIPQVGEACDQTLIEFVTSVDCKTFPIYYAQIVTEAVTDAHNDATIQNNWIYGNGTTTTGINLVGVVGGSVTSNEVSDMAFSGIGLKGCQNIATHGNRLYRNDSAYTLAGSDTTDMGLLALNNSFTGNFVDGDGDDGAVKIDNYDAVNSLAARQDSLWVIGGNVYYNVAQVGAWVSVGNSQTNFATMSGWAAQLASMNAIFLDEYGSLDDPAGGRGLYKKAGLLPGKNTRGTVGPHW